MDSFFKFIFYFGIFIGIPVISGLKGGIKFIFGRIFGRKVVYFRYGFFLWTESRGSSWIRFSPICELSMVKEDEQESSVIRSFVMETAVNILICTLAGIFSVNMWKNDVVDRRIAAFCLGVCLWYIIDILVMFISLYFALKRRNSPLAVRLNEIMKQMKSDVTFDRMDIPDYREFQGKSNKSEVLNYLNFQFAERLAADDIDSIHEIAECMEKELYINYINKPKEYLLSRTKNYYNLLYYYTAVKLDLDRARYFHGMLKKQLDGDMDADSRLLLSAFAFYVKRDIPAAERYANSASEAVYSRKYKAERELEHEMLRKLTADIYEAKKEEEKRC